MELKFSKIKVIGEKADVVFCFKDENKSGEVAHYVDLSSLMDKALSDIISESENYLNSTIPQP